MNGGQYMYESLEKLKSKKEKIERLLVQEKHKLDRLMNRRKYYENGERQKRAHRLITKGAAIESIAPELKEMSEQDFYELMSDVFNQSVVKVIIHQKVGEPL